MPGADPVATAAMVVAMARDERFAEITELFAAPLRAAVSADALRVAWTAEVARAGAVQTIGPPAAEPPAGGRVRVSTPVGCARGGLTVIMSVDGEGVLQGLRLAPATPESAPQWAPPAYARPERFAEHDVTVDDGARPLPGTLTLPRTGGPVPAVVLLGGSGATIDRDATVGPNKPLKDLAWGLASRGVAVLRFDKVTYARPETLAPGMTLTAEYVPHAAAAVRLLRGHPGVDPGRVFVAGHSMGGKAAPRVAAAEPVAGLVILAGDTTPMHEAAVRVVRYLAALSPGPAADAAVAAMTRQASAAAGPDLTAGTPAADLPLGLPGSYWLDLRAYDPVGTAAALDVPMLILQGGRDYQVTAAGDLPRWRTGLAGRADVTISVHEACDHQFFHGTGPSTPADLERPDHVDPAVVAEIAAWLTAPRG